MEQQKKWAYMHTEDYIREKELEELEWNRKNKKQQEIYMAQIEKKLRERTQTSREELLELFRKKEFIDAYKTENDMAYMIVIMQIYENEKRAGTESCILDMGTESREIKSKLQELKFILWRMEFAKDVQGKEMLVNFIHENQPTAEMIQYIVLTSSNDKPQMLIKLADIFIEQSMLSYAFRMLEYAEELVPGDEEILCILTQLCICVGNQKRAGEYLNKVKNPGELTEGIRRKYGC